MSMQVLPTAPSPTVTHLMNRDALIAGVDVDLLAFLLLPLLASCPRPREGRPPGADGGGKPAGRSWQRRDGGENRTASSLSLPPVIDRSHGPSRRPAHLHLFFVSSSATSGLCSLAAELLVVTGEVGPVGWVLESVELRIIFRKINQ
jgi:hypothetical protein